ncbi:unnamed protein product [Durusdinium trenchii]|uniref:Uncharacterized protein n=2 Tax=Durusdinium trenchii TaxID=1381693 RepID=A0ABP0S562_9DINO
MCEGNCACNLAAKVSFGVSVVLVLIGSIVYAIGAIQAADLAASSIIVDGQRSFTLQAEEGKYLAGFTFFGHRGMACEMHSQEIESQIPANAGFYESMCGWRRGSLKHNGQEVKAVGHYSPYDNDLNFYSLPIAFVTTSPTWVLDAAIDPSTVSDALALVGITMIGFLILCAGVIMCFVTCCAMCCNPEARQPAMVTTIVQPQQPCSVQALQHQPVIVGQPVMGQAVVGQPVPA